MSPISTLRSWLSGSVSTSRRLSKAGLNVETLEARDVPSAAPSNIYPSAQDVYEDVPAKLQSLHVYDDDDGAGNLSVTLTVAHGTLSYNGSTGKSVTISAYTAAEVNTGLENVTYTSDLNFNGTDTLQIATVDGEGLTDNDSSVINVHSTNDAPVNHGPTGPISNVGGSSVAITGLSVSDVDTAGPLGHPNGRISVWLSCTNGSIFVGDGPGDVSGSGSSMVNILGTVPEVNARLATVTYKGNRGFQGTDTITMRTNDNSNGEGVALEDVDTFSVAVTVPNRAPVVTISQNTNIFVEDASANLASVTIADPNASDIVTTVLTVQHGNLTIGGINRGKTYTLTGTSAQVSSLLGTILYQGDQDYYGPDSLTIVSTDAGGLSQTKVLSFDVGAVNDAPIAVVPVVNIPIDENSIDNPIAGLSVTDVDAENGILTAVVTVFNGTLTIGGSGGTVADNGTDAITITGTLSQIQDRLANVTYTPNKDFVGTDTLTVAIDDDGNTGGGALNDSASVSIDVTSTGGGGGSGNHAPTHSISQNVISFNEDTLVTLASVTVGDVDVGDIVTTTLTVEHGSLTITGVGTGKTLTITGTPTQVSTTLQGIKYQGDPDYFGDDTLTISTQDSTGSSAVDNAIAFSVLSVNDAPVNITPTAIAAVINTNRRVSVSIQDVDDAGGTMSTTLSASRGKFSVGGTPVAVLTLTGTKADINNQLLNLRYYAGSASGQNNITVTTTDNGNSGAGGARTTLTQFRIDTTSGSPTIVTVPGAKTTNENTTLAVTGITISDTDTRGTFTAYLTVTHGTLSVTGSAAAPTGNGTNSLKIFGTFTGVANMLKTLQYTPDTNYSGSDQIIVNFTDYTGLDSIQKTINITVVPVASPASLSVTGLVSGSSGSGVTVSGLVNVPTNISLNADLTDIDGSETLVIRLTNVPASITFSAGTKVTSTIWQFTPAQLTNLKFTATQAGSFTLGALAISTEIANNSQSVYNLPGGITLAIS